MVSDTDRLRFEGDEFYFKSAEEMRELFAQAPDACDATLTIAEMVDIDLETKSFAMPSVSGAGGPSKRTRLFAIAVHDGSERTIRRADRRTAQPLGVRTGHHRTDGVRFLLPDRVGFHPLRPRAGDTRWTRPRLGGRQHRRILAAHLGRRPAALQSCSSSASSIRSASRCRISTRISASSGATKSSSTSRRNTARIASRRSSRSARWRRAPPCATSAGSWACRSRTSIKIAKLIPNIPTNPVSIQQAIDAVPGAHQIYQRDGQARKLLDTAMRVEGLARHASTHAAGVVIAPGPITDYAPLVRSSAITTSTRNTRWSGSKKSACSRWISSDCERSRSWLRPPEEIRRTADPAFSLDGIPLDDPKTYRAAIGWPDHGVFQLESAGMRRYIAELKPTRIEDVIAMVALYRPGPMDWISDFIAGKHGRRKISVPASQARADPRRDLRHRGLPRTSDADVPRPCRLHSRASRRDAQSHRQEDQRENPHPSAKSSSKAACATASTKQLATKIWQFIEPFAGYGFNKAHSVCYGLLAYRTAWLKANYPLAFMAALLTSMKSNSDKLVEYLAECAPHEIDDLAAGRQRERYRFHCRRTGQYVLALRR